MRDPSLLMQNGQKRKEVAVAEFDRKLAARAVDSLKKVRRLLEINGSAAVWPCWAPLRLKRAMRALQAQCPCKTKGKWFREALQQQHLIQSRPAPSARYLFKGGPQASNFKKG